MDPVSWLLVPFEAALLAPLAIGLRQIARDYRS